MDYRYNLYPDNSKPRYQSSDHQRPPYPLDTSPHGDFISQEQQHVPIYPPSSAAQMPNNANPLAHGPQGVIPNEYDAQPSLLTRRGGAIPPYASAIPQYNPSSYNADPAVAAAAAAATAHPWQQQQPPQQQQRQPSQQSRRIPSGQHYYPREYPSHIGMTPTHNTTRLPQSMPNNLANTQQPPQHITPPNSRPGTYGGSQAPLRPLSSYKPQGYVPILPPAKFRKVYRPDDLAPQSISQSGFRRADPDVGYISPLMGMTVKLLYTYTNCNPSFTYESSRNPRRVLTKLTKTTRNNGYDNEDNDYILYVNDVLSGKSEQQRYIILDVLGQGTFGQVVKCQNVITKEICAVKIVKNKQSYFNQSLMEVSILEMLNSSIDKNDEHHILRLTDKFIHREHLCIAFELLSSNLYELIKQNHFRGLSTSLVRVFAQQLLDGLCLLKECKLIHCDLKPENILLKNLESPSIKIIDFGSACHERQTVYTYIQSRFYRSPEVLLGLPYSAAIDMWSLGCIVAELFLGLPLFPGSSEYNQVTRIIEMLGLPPNWMLEMGKQSKEYFDRYVDEYGQKYYRLKPLIKYCKEHRKEEEPSRRYFAATKLPEIVNTYPLPRRNLKPKDVDKEMENRASFVDFLSGLLNMNPMERWTPHQARLHPFIQNKPFLGPFKPPPSSEIPQVARDPIMPNISGTASALYASAPSTGAPQQQQQQQRQAQYQLGKRQQQQQQPGSSGEDLLYKDNSQSQPMYGATKDQSGTGYQSIRQTPSSFPGMAPSESGSPAAAAMISGQVSQTNINLNNNNNITSSGMNQSMSRLSLLPNGETDDSRQQGSSQAIMRQSSANNNNNNNNSSNNLYRFSETYNRPKLNPGNSSMREPPIPPSIQRAGAMTDRNDYSLM